MQIVQTAPLVNECFGVGVTSEAMDGAAPELNHGRVPRRNNSNSEAQHTSHIQLINTHKKTADCIHNLPLIKTIKT